MKLCLEGATSHAVFQWAETRVSLGSPVVYVRPFDFQVGRVQLWDCPTGPHHRRESDGG